MIKAKGTTLIINKSGPPITAFQVNVEKILSKTWPPIILAVNRNPKLKALAKYEIVSIITKTGTNPKGVPAGTNNPKNFNAWVWKPKIVTPIKIATLNPIPKTKWLEGVNEYGTKPIKLDNNTYKKIVYKKGK